MTADQSDPPDDPVASPPADESDNKVISLAERRNASQRGEPRRSAKGAGPVRAGPGAGPGAGADESGPVPGRLIWLFCPTCGTLEYTELELAGGRSHNVCGKPVHEAVVEMDLRGEATVAQINLARLELLEQVLTGQRQRYEEYLHRLNLAARRPLAPYAVSEEAALQGDGPLPAVQTDALGLLVTPFFVDPTERFPGLKPRPPDSGKPDGGGPKDGNKD